MKKTKFFATSFFLSSAILGSSFLTLKANNNAFQDNQVASQTSLQQSAIIPNSDAQTKMSSSTIYSGTNINLEIQYSTNSSMQLIFVNKSSVLPSNIKNINYKISDSTNGSIVDFIYAPTNGANYYASNYSTAQLVPGSSYDFDVSFYYNYVDPITNSTSLKTYNETFSAIIPARLNPMFTINGAIPQNSSMPSINDGSLNVVGVANADLFHSYDSLYVGLTDTSTGQLVNQTIIDLDSTNTSSQTFNISIPDLFSGSYDLMIYGLTTSANNDMSFDYLNSVRNIVIGYDNPDPSPELNSQVVSAYATSSSTANVSIYTKNAYLTSETPLEYSIDNGATFVEIPLVNEGVTEINLAGLEANVTYTFGLYLGGTLLDSKDFTTSTEAIVNAPILGLNNTTITTNSATLTYDLFSADLIQNLSYTIYEDGTLLNSYSISDYQTGTNTLQIDNLKPDTVYSVEMYGTHALDQSRSYTAFTSFKTSVENYVQPTLQISTLLGPGDLINYSIKGVDTAHRIQSINLALYGANNAINQQVQTELIKNISVTNKDMIKSGIILQDDLRSYDNVFVVVTAIYLDQNNEAKVMTQSELRISTDLSFAGANTQNVLFYTPDEVALYNPTVDSLFNKGVEVLFILLFIVFFLATLIFGALLYKYMHSQKLSTNSSKAIGEGASGNTTTVAQQIDSSNDTKNNENNSSDDLKE